MTDGQRRPLIVVLGMHRSGTSLCANILTALGVDMAETPGASPANARGHWERHRLCDLHDEVFAMHGGTWIGAGHNLALPDNWRAAPGIAGIEHRIVEYMSRVLASAELVGFKDPRTTRVLPLWDALFDRLGVEPRFIFCVRNPSQVARSLEARDQSARAEGEYRWLMYNAHGVAGLGKRPLCIIPYEDWFTQPLATAERLARWVHPDRSYRPESLETLVAGVLDPDLRHDPPDPLTAGTAARTLHAMIAAAAADDALPPPLLAYAAHFLDFEQSVRPLLRETVTLRASVTDQNRVIRDLQAAVQALRQEQRVG
jgi:hypothetical protein